ncbi:thiol:disulfide interchange protein DsbA/DsbL [Chitinimonas sp.]|uniref:thiol:disulfide interchange protein DsbA/DsbL n=1 Tax=Chitinimonas sp. TaxID=1934313 RepID=UPI0035B39952
MRLPALVLTVVLGCLSYLPAGAADLREGIDYDVLPAPISSEAPGKVEVVEFFWYGCPHCFSVEPQVEAWAKRLPANVVFRREHAMFAGNSSWGGHARLFVALKTLGLVDSMTPKVFDAIQVKHIELRDEATLFDWIAKQGINRARFEAAYKSSAADAGMQRQIQQTRAAGIDGVPEFIVNGRYKTSPVKLQSEVRTFEVINQLISLQPNAAKPALQPN